MPEAPREPEACGTARGTFLSRRDQRGHRGEVIRVTRVPKAEEDGDAGDDEERRSVGEGRDLVVEPKHRYLTFGRA